MKNLVTIFAAITIATFNLFSQDCGQLTTSCITTTIVDMQYNDDNTAITLSVSLDADCMTNNAVSHVSFGLPQGIAALSPSDSDIYTSELTGLEYNVENTANVPFHSIKFNVEAGLEGIRAGEEDEFVFTIPAGIDVESIPVEVKIGSTSTIMDIVVNDECRLAAVMPVDLMTFSAREDNGTVELAWATASEENSSHFEVQRSVDGQNWAPIGDVTSNHNSTVVNEYTFIDRTPTGTENYYRLKMIDLDETFEYSDIIMVKMGAANVEFEVRAFPNPTTDYLQVTLQSDEMMDVNIQVTTMNGDVVKTMATSANGSSTQRIDVSDYPTGMYFLTVDNGETVETQKFMKK